MEKVRTFFALFANIATVINCIVTVTGVCIGAKFVIDVQPIIEKHFINSEKTDTVIYRDTLIIVHRDTVFVQKPVFQDSSALNFEEYLERAKKEFEHYVNEQKTDFEKFVDTGKTDFEDFVNAYENGFQEFLNRK
jgi:hypothetical protein